MTGLLIVGGGILGALGGGSLGLMAAMVWGSMEPASMDGLTFPLAGASVGAVVGTFAVAELLT